MTRTVSILLAGVFVAGVVSADARTVAPVVAGSVSAYASMVAQDDVAAKVKAALAGNADLSAAAAEVTVTAAGNVVTLEGTVPTVQLRAKIAEFVMKIDGVGKLNNKLKLAKK